MMLRVTLSVKPSVPIIEKTDALGNQFPYRTNVANSIHKGLPAPIPFNEIYLSTLATFKVLESIKENGARIFLD